MKTTEDTYESMRRGANRPGDPARDATEAHSFFLFSPLPNRSTVGLRDKESGSQNPSHTTHHLVRGMKQEVALQ